MARKRSRSSLSGTSFLLIFLFLLIVGGGVAVFFLFFEGDKPTLSFENTPEFFNTQATVSFSATDRGSGLKTVMLTVKQGDKSYELFRKDFPRERYTNPVGPLEVTETVNFDPKKAGLSDGKLQLELYGVDFSARNMLAGNAHVLQKTVLLDTEAPKISLLHTEKYISPGGSGIVIYKMDDSSAKHGLKYNNLFAPGFKLGDQPDTYIAYFGLPHDTESLDQLSITATDTAGNSNKINFTTNFKRKTKKKDKINITDGFLSRKIPEFEQSNPGMEGDLLQKFLIVNNRMRIANNTKIADLCTTSHPERMWKGRFERMPGSPKADFAEYRSYLYKGKVIDNQVHLGVDIASTKHAKIRAANHGIVVFADYLGIYGKTIILDHGQGIFSLYSHLSQFNVSAGDKVNKGDLVGLTGTSGMAGGDHLHFSMLVHGVFVTPKEWFDGKWIESNIDEPILNSKF